MLSHKSLCIVQPHCCSHAVYLLARAAPVHTEVGSKAMDGGLTNGARLSLWHTLLDGGRRAVDAAGEDPKVRACMYAYLCCAACVCVCL